MDTLKFIFALLPYAGYILAFLAGCWFYRWMLKRNPEMLQKLVHIVNSTGDYAKAGLDKVGNVIVGDTSKGDQTKK